MAKCSLENGTLWISGNLQDCDMGVAKITVSSSFSCLVSYFSRNFEVSFMLLYGFLDISKTVIGVAKITVRFSFSCPVSHFFRNFEVSFMVLYGFLKISKTVEAVSYTHLTLPTNREV